MKIGCVTCKSPLLWAVLGSNAIRYNQDFPSSSLFSTQNGTIRNFEIIGEAAHHVSKELRESNDTKIEWRKVIAFRHILVHDYYKVNTEIVWNAIENKLIDMKIEVKRVLDEL